MSTLRIYLRSLVLFWELSIGTCRFHTRDSMHIGLFLLALEQSFLFKSFMTWLCVTEVHSFLWWSYVFWTQFLRNSSKVCVCLVIVTSILRSGLLWQIMLKRYTLPFNFTLNKTVLSCGSHHLDFTIEGFHRFLLTVLHLWLYLVTF